MIDLKQLEDLARETGTISHKIDWFMRFDFALGVAVRIMPWLYYEPGEAVAIAGRFGSGNPIDPHFWDYWQDNDGFGTDDTERRTRETQIDMVFDRLDAYRYLGVLEERNRFPLELILCCDSRMVANWGEEEFQSALANPDDPGTFTRIALRDPIRLQLVAGTAIDSLGDRGTLGGFIQAADGRVFGVTCGHVSANGVVHAAASGISGKIVKANSPVIAPPGTVCNPWPSPHAATAPTNFEDCALIEWSTPPHPTGEQIALSLGEREHIEIRGSQSRSRFVVKSLSIATKITHNDQSHCFGSLVELRPQRGWQVTRPGDSGAWGFRMEGNRATNEWGVMLVGASNEFSYAIDAWRVLSWATGALGQECRVY